MRVGKDSSNERAKEAENVRKMHLGAARMLSDRAFQCAANAHKGRAEGGCWRSLRLVRDRAAY